MGIQKHPLAELFSQLGLSSDTLAIDQFLKMHSPLDNRVLLADAPFWSSSQKQFLIDELINDAEWAEPIDLLNTELRQDTSS